MTDVRHPDIEIYVKGRTLDEIQSWLSSHTNELNITSSKGQIHEIDLLFGEHWVPVMIHEKVAGKAWTSVWFKTNQSPWAQDLACARAASAEMDTQVRCIANGWEEGDDPDEYWKIENQTEEKIQWRT